MNPLEKYILRTKTITQEEARAKRANEVDHMQSEIDALVAELEEFKKTPLVLEQTFQEKVLPGHPDYDFPAVFHFSPEHYHGDMVWHKG